MIEAKYIKQLVQNGGFDECGITSPRHMSLNEQAFADWIERGYSSSLDYMRRYQDKRFDVRCLVEGARTVVVCAVAYDGPVADDGAACPNPKIAAYASRQDYHKILRKRLQTILRELQLRYPHLQGRIFVDSAPLLEKQLAVDAGLGWIGRQSLLISPRWGSYLLLCEMVLDDEVDTYNTPYEGVRCGECHRCQEACPTQAIVRPMVVDTSRCISCHTIESEPSSQVDLHGWVFGCDECQMVCPYNRSAEPGAGMLLPREFSYADIPAEEWLQMSDEEFLQRFGPTPLKRAGLKKIQSNIKHQ